MWLLPSRLGISPTQSIIKPVTGSQDGGGVQPFYQFYDGTEESGGKKKKDNAVILMKTRRNSIALPEFRIKPQALPLSLLGNCALWKHPSTCCNQNASVLQAVMLVFQLLYPTVLKLLFSVRRRLRCVYDVWQAI